MDASKKTQAARPVCASNGKTHKDLPASPTVRPIKTCLCLQRRDHKDLLVSPMAKPTKTSKTQKDLRAPPTARAITPQDYD